MIRRRLAGLAAGVAIAVATTGCGGEPRELAGYRRDPAPEVGDLSLPDLGNDDLPFAFRADPGDLLVVYFGFTNCPDICPTTMSDLRFAVGQLDDDLADRIDVAMVTVDPERDLTVLPHYVGSFFPDGHALGTADPAALAAVAAPFGVGYDVRGSGDDTEVDHSTSLYAVDDDGELILTWQYGVPPEELAADLDALLDLADDETSDDETSDSETSGDEPDDEADP